MKQSFISSMLFGLISWLMLIYPYLESVGKKILVMGNILLLFHYSLHIN